MTSPTIAASQFAINRHTADSILSHFEGSWDELVEMVSSCWGQQKPGYRDGVVLVPVPADRFKSTIVFLREGDRLEGEFRARQRGEKPRRTTWVVRDGEGKQDAVAVDIVLYRADVLEEDGDRSSDAEWEIISVNARISEEDAPMDPGTLMANHFKASGGTATNMTPEEFEAALRESFTYWADKGKIGPSRP